MPSRPPRFDQAAATAALGYIASRLPSVDTHKAFKLLYLAEKDYLGRYGRTFAGDQYIAMEYGPVPSVLYDLIKATRGEPLSHRITPEMATNFARWIDVKGYVLLAKEAPDTGELSSGALRCIDDAILKYASWSFDQLTRETHDPAWDAARARFVPGHITLRDIARALPNSERLVAHLEGE